MASSSGRGRDLLEQSRGRPLAARPRRRSFSGGLFLAVADDRSALYRASVESPGLVPEPGTLILCLTGLALAANTASRKRCMRT